MLLTDHAEKSSNGRAGCSASCYFKGMERKRIVADDVDRKNFVVRMGNLAAEMIRKSQKHPIPGNWRCTMPTLPFVNLLTFSIPQPAPFCCCLCEWLFSRDRRAYMKVSALSDRPFCRLEAVFMRWKPVRMLPPGYKPFDDVIES